MEADGLYDVLAVGQDVVCEMCIRDRAFILAIPIPSMVLPSVPAVMLPGFACIQMCIRDRAGSFRAAIYCRLSKDDDLDGESASIANQRDMLEKYCEKQDPWSLFLCLL